MKKLLFIDDNWDVLNIFKEYFLSEDNYSVYIAEDGNLGFSLAKKYIPDIIVLDINMPKVSGLEVMKFLKDSEITKNIPVVVLTANNQNSPKVKFISSFSEKVLFKPLTFFSLKEELDSIINKK